MSNYSLSARTEQVISAQKSRIQRQDGQIDSLQLEAGELERQLERIGAGLWQILATTISAADANPGEATLISRCQTASGMYAVWCAVVDGDGHE
jgi:hypothetical protein